jgi:CRISPR system Cascade subunit CasD
MSDYILFRLYGPMSSWGDIAVGEFRPSFAYPSKSAVLGLVAAALGIRRDEETVHQAMASSYGFAVRVEAAGSPIRDYHTAQVPPAGSGPRKKTFATRKDELAVPIEDLGTILSSRDYRCDSLYTACLWIVGDSSPYSLAQLEAALAKPAFTLYLGRKSCPLALPLQPQVVQASNLREAFHSARFEDTIFLNSLPGSETVNVYWEGAETNGYTAVHTIERRDSPLSRRRWQFAVRSEHYATESASREQEE